MKRETRRQTGPRETVDRRADREGLRGKRPKGGGEEEQEECEGRAKARRRI